MKRKFRVTAIGSFARCANTVPAAILALAVAVSMLLLPTVGHGQVPEGLVRDGAGRVVEVVDGDTVILDTGDEVRLVGMQAPKLPLGRPDFEPWPLADDAAAALTELVLGERVDMATWGILLLALVGVTLMVGDGLSTGSMLGNLAAVGGAVSFAGFVVIFRAKRQVDMMPSVVIGGFMAMAVAAVMTGGQLSIPLPDLALSVFWGGIISSAVLALFTVASRHLSGAELTLLLMLEYFLGPFWVWLFINEVPSMMTLVGGAIVLSGVLAQAYLSSARPKMA